MDELSTQQQMDELSAVTDGFATGIMIFGFLFLIILIAAFWKIYTKAGKPGWASFVPIYGTLVFLDIIGKPRWWFIMFLIPLVNIYFLVWSYNMLSKSFGKSEGFTAGLVFFSYIFFPILGFGSAKYTGPYGLGGATGASDVLDSNV